LKRSLVLTFRGYVHQFNQVSPKRLFRQEHCGLASAVRSLLQEDFKDDCVAQSQARLVASAQRVWSYHGAPSEDVSAVSQPSAICGTVAMAA
jgi:hypothetical protein